MPHHVPGLPWTDDQWASVERVVQEAARNARVASSFLPLVGPLPPGQASVPKLTMKPERLRNTARGEATERLEIDDGDTAKLTTIACEVYLTTQQAQDPELASAKQMLARAADIIGRVEDAIIFNGQPAPPGIPARPDLKPWVSPEIYSVSNGDRSLGLLRGAGVGVTASTVDGNTLVSLVIAAVQELESNGHHGPFACVLGRQLYQAATTPSGSLVLPSDRFVPFLEGGPLRRSSVVPDHQGVVVALAGAPIDLVVGSDVHIRFLQLSLEPRYVLRVAERFVLRIKQREAACYIGTPHPDRTDEEIVTSESNPAPSGTGAPSVAPPEPPGPPT